MLDHINTRSIEKKLEFTHIAYPLDSRDRLIIDDRTKRPVRLPFNESIGNKAFAKKMYDGGYNNWITITKSELVTDSKLQSVVDKNLKKDREGLSKLILNL